MFLRQASRHYNLGHFKWCVDLWCPLFECLWRPGMELKSVLCICVCRCCVRMWPKQTSMLWSRTFFIFMTWRLSVSEGHTYKTPTHIGDVCVWDKHLVLPQMVSELWQKHTCTTNSCHPGETFFCFLVSDLSDLRNTDVLWNMLSAAPKTSPSSTPHLSSHSLHNMFWQEIPLYWFNGEI